MKHVKTNKWGWLVGAAVLVMGFVACTNEDSLTDAPAGPQNAQKVHITVGASIADDATTRSEIDATQTDANGKAIRTLKFTEGDKLYVYAMYGLVDDDMNYQLYPSFMAGMLEIDPASITNGMSASFTGDLTTYEWDPDQSKYVETDHVFTHEDPLEDCAEFCEEPTYYFQPGVPPEGVFAQLVHAGSEATFKVEDDPTEADFCSSFWYHFNNSSYLASDIDEFLTSRLEVMANTYDKDNHRFELSSPDQTAIFNCVISGLLPNTNYSVDIGDQYGCRTPGKVTTDGAGIAQFVADFYEDGWGEEKPYSITLKDFTNPDYVIPLGTRTLEKKIYNVSRMWNGEAFVSGTDLSTKTDSYEAQNGEMLTGVFGAGDVKQNWNVKIPDGATVILNGVDITNVKEVNNDQKSGIECLGDATIILCGTNKVKNGSYYKPAILVPDGKTLTIRGSGKLIADASYSNAAGIGGGNNDNCGNIIIEGGDITATGAGYSAGIGGGDEGHSCGTIEIRGGNVNATGGEGAGIGSGENGSCVTITISGGNVTATGDDGAGIGSGYNGSCGTITISGGNVTATGGSGAGIGSGYAFGGTSTCGAITIYDTVTKVTASKNGADCSIGKGSNGTCGTVTIGGTVYWDGSNYQSEGDTYLTQNEIVYPAP